jgi:tripartite ATP-independent transporter DctP family solute receptor
VAKTIRLSRRTCARGLAVTAAAFTLRHRSRAAEPIQLRLATADTVNDASYPACVRFGEEIARRTNGKYNVQMYVNGALGTTLNLVNSLQTGILDVAGITAGFLESFFPKIQLLDLPFIFNDQPSAERILDGEVGDEIKAQMEQRGVIGVGWGWMGWREMETRVKQIVHPDDFRGVKMRVQPGPVFIAMFKALGAIPVPIDSTEIYLSLSQKTVDGVDFPIPTVVSFKAFEVCKYLALTNHVYNAAALMVSKALWGRLDADERKAFMDAGAIGTRIWREAAAKAIVTNTQFLNEHGMIINKVDIAEFRAKMEPCFKEFRPNYPELFDKILKLQS